ncbi:phosphoribosylamine--glycine ligase [Helicobacter anatolicus]|uniref:phosphoribosylamine--glycine ligase n=1 Tax=Helicobacter anatolicus TaxID=2905874 RepID=UPI001E5563CD|nr:phosphoribosylamine--glycine ligase [Helicobacter anatolicus]MCE3038088.1 phosphoribosylamine--glycine ligase [Helicobacter anatolicus]
MKNILILGSGGREYAIALHLLKDKFVDNLYFTPNNAGVARLGKILEYKTPQELIEKIQDLKIDFVIVGPEAYIVDGITDLLHIAGIKVFGPSKKAGMLEGSKAYMKDFVTRYNVPTARYIQTTDLKEAIAFLKNLTPPYVLKADGLCAGKGVLILEDFNEAVRNLEEMLSGKAFGDSGKCVVIEEYLEGFELSVFAVCDGENFQVLPACQDHKRLLDNDEGPNTGGMGAYSPAPSCDITLMEKIKNKILKPTLDGLLKEGNPFCGILFAGIMVQEKNGELEPFLLEYNVRFGDPECEVLMPLLKTPLREICEHVFEKKLDSLKIEFYPKSAMAVVVASKDYPYTKSIPMPISFKDYDSTLGHIVFAGVDEIDGKLYATGGRVLLCVGIGENVLEARNNAYKLIESVYFEGMHYRKDIGYRVLDAIK